MNLRIGFPYEKLPF